LDKLGSDLETRNYTYGVDDSDKKADFSDNTIHPIASHEKIIPKGIRWH
jgi:hypothetical protein